MKNKVKLITGGIIFYLIVIFVSIYFLLIPGISKISKASSYKELTFEEKSKLIDEINNKYTKLESEINDKYIKLDEEVNITYDPLIEEVNVKYSNLVSEVENNYKTKESDIVSKINDAKVRQNKEFFKSGFSDNYYSIGEELKSLEKEKDNILKEKNKNQLGENCFGRDLLGKISDITKSYARRHVYKNGSTGTYQEFRVTAETFKQMPNGKIESYPKHIKNDAKVMQPWLFDKFSDLYEA